jgi:hypothetical protein
MASDQEIILAQQRELNELRASTERTALHAGLATAIQSTGYTLAPGAAPQLQKILADEARVNRDTDGSLKVTGPGFQDVNTWVKDRLSSPEYAHFTRPGSAPVASHTAGAQPFGQTGDQPRTLSEAVILQMKTTGHGAGRDGRTDMGAPFGLRGIR